MDPHVESTRMGQLNQATTSKPLGQKGQNVSQLTTLGNVVEGSPKEVASHGKSSMVNNMTIAQKDNCLPTKELPQMFQQGDGRG